MDRDRRYFISTTGSMEAGTPFVRYRWRQVDATEGAYPEMVERTVPQPTIAETYYVTCAAIDKNNRCRQDDLAMENRLKQRSGQSFNLCHVCRRHMARLQRLQAIRRHRSDE